MIQKTREEPVRIGDTCQFMWQLHCRTYPRTRKGGTAVQLLSQRNQGCPSVRADNATLKQNSL